MSPELSTATATKSTATVMKFIIGLLL